MLCTQPQWYWGINNWLLGQEFSWRRQWQQGKQTDGCFNNQVAYLYYYNSKGSGSVCGSCIKINVSGIYCVHLLTVKSCGGGKIKVQIQTRLSPSFMCFSRGHNYQICWNDFKAISHEFRRSKVFSKVRIMPTCCDTKASHFSGHVARNYNTNCGHVSIHHVCMKLISHYCS